jgi:hypothetical protein
MGHKLRTIYLPFFLVFLSGAVAGGLGHRLYTLNTVKADAPPGSEESRRRYLEDMKTRLKLSPDQLSKLSAILDETREKVKAVREQDKPEMKAIREAHAARVNAILSDQQRAEYAKLREERERRRMERERLEQEREEKEKAARSRR